MGFYRLRRPRMRSPPGFLAVGLAVLTAGAVSIRASAAPAMESKYAVMAAFLYNFMSFVEWPAEQPYNEGPVSIGILGANPFGDATKAIEKKTVGGRPIQVRQFRDLASLEPTHILFVGQDFAGRMDELCRNLGQRAVLTVGESEDFTRHGGIIRFFEVAPGGADRQLRLEVNETAARSAGLAIRSKLLRLCSVTNYPVDGGR